MKFRYGGKVYRNSHRRCSVKKGILRNSTKFTGKPLCHRLFFNKVAGLQASKKRCLLKKSVYSFFFNNSSSHRRCSVKKNMFLKIGLQLYSKRDSNTSVFLWVLRNFSETFFAEQFRLTDCSIYERLLLFCEFRQSGMISAGFFLDYC